MTFRAPPCISRLFPKYEFNTMSDRYEVKQSWRLSKVSDSIEILILIYISLPVHLGIILVNNQLDALFQCIYLFHFSICFQQPRAHHQESQLYQNNLWYVSLCVGDRFVFRSESFFPTCTRNGHRHRVTHTRGCFDTIDSPDDEHGVAGNI